MCTVIVQVVRFVDTTMDPNQPWKITSRRTPTEVRKISGSDFLNFRDCHARAIMKNPMITPVRRFTYSIHVLTGLNSVSSRIDLSLRILLAVSLNPNAE